jgi:hypothetical protein
MTTSASIPEQDVSFTRQEDSILNELSACEFYMRGALKLAGFSALEIAPHFARQSGRGDLELRSYHAVHPHKAEARCAMIRGPKSEIINLMIFPWAPSSCPVYASELILFNGKMHVAVVDLQFPDPALQSRLASIIGKPSRRYRSKLTYGGELPDWARQHFTPWCVYNRANSADETPVVCDAFIEYLDLWIEHCLPCLVGQKEELASLRHYQVHHIENTPGRKFLSRGFSPEWAESYLQDFMYGPLNESFQSSIQKALQHP